MARVKYKKRFSAFGLILVILVTVALGFFVLKKSFLTPFCANSETCINDLSGTYNPKVKLAEFMGDFVPIPVYLSEEKSSNKVLAEVSVEDKRIEVDLSNQILYAYQNGQLIMSFPVSTGKWYHTPTGVYHIWIKLRYTRMSGGNLKRNTYYNLPNVPHTMYFYNEEHPKIQGFGLHGAYWHNNFGHPMSHGCVNISLEDAEKLYNWADPVAEKNVTYASDENPGTVVIIYGTTPRE